MRSMKLKLLDDWLRNWGLRARSRVAQYRRRSAYGGPSIPDPGTQEDVTHVKGVLDHLAGRVRNGDTVSFAAGLWEFSSEIRRYLHSFVLDGAPSDMMLRYVNDSLQRFLRTLTLLPINPDLKVLEMGGNPWLFSLLMERLLDFDVSYTNFFDHNVFNAEISDDRQFIESAEFGERYVFQYKLFNMELCEYPYPDDSFDVVLFCEILEHLILDPLSTFDRIKRVLKPGGLLILTTPNAVRITNLGAMLAGRNYFDLYHPETSPIYGRHNREYTVGEMRSLLVENGFRVLRLFTEDRHDYDAIYASTVNYEGIHKVFYRKGELLELLHYAGGDVKHRGDNIYAVAEKQA